MITMKIATRLWSSNYACMCAAGLVWQLTTIIDLFFQYKVSTAVNIFTPAMLEPLAMTLCVNIAGVVDHEKMNKDLGTNYSKNDNGRIKLDFTNLSFQTLFDYTPSNDSILQQFSFKTKKSRLKHIKDNVSNNVDVIKFLQRIYVCYTITVKGDEALKYRDISVSNTNHFLV